MGKSSFHTVQRLVLLAFVAFTIVLVTVSTLLSQSGVQPDEYRYMQGAFHTPLSQNPLGNYLFSWLFGLSSHCGSGWYLCGKILNLSALTSGSLVVGSLTYAATQNWNRSIFVGLVVLGGTTAVYSPFFMPDTMAAVLTIIGIFLLSVSAKQPFKSAPKWIGIGSGSLLGLAWLSKPHTIAAAVALFAVLAILLFFGRRRSHRDDLTTTVSLALVVMLSLRLVGGLVLAGPASLNIFGSYGGLARADEQLASSVSSSSFIEGGIAATSNLAPAILVLSLAFILKSRVNRELKVFASIAREPIFSIPFVFLISYASMGAAFAFLLEFRGAEDAMFRALTRYWEFGLVPLAVALIVGWDHSQAQDLERRIAPSDYVAIALLVLTSSYVVLLLSVYQSEADTALLRAPIATVAIAAVGALLGLLRWRRVRNIPAYALGLVTLSVGLLAWGGEFRTASNEVAGTDVGLWIMEQKEDDESFANGLVFIGDRTIADVSAFTGRLQKLNYHPAPVYSKVSIGDLPDETRVVVASREVYFTGEYAEAFVVGDQIVYELTNDNAFHPKDFQSRGIASSEPPNFVHWGAWYESASLTLTFPEDFDFNGIRLDLVANRTLSPPSIKVTWTGGQTIGELLPNQELTPVQLIRQDGQSWAGQSLTLEILGELVAEEGYSNSSTIGIANLRGLQR